MKSNNIKKYKIKVRSSINPSIYSIIRASFFASRLGIPTFRVTPVGVEGPEVVARWMAMLGERELYTYICIIYNI